MDTIGNARRTRPALVASIGLVGICVAGAAISRGPSATPPTDMPAPTAGVSIPVAPEEVGSSGRTFLEERSRRQAARAGVLESAGRGAALTALRRLAKASVRTRPSSLELDASGLAELANQDAEAVAQFLAVVGYGPSDLAPGEPASLRVVESAIRLVLGRGMLADRVRAAPLVLVADLDGVALDSTPDDGFGSTATFTVVEPIKGGVRSGATLQVRQGSDTTIEGELVLFPSDFQLGQRGRYLIFVSDAAYEVRGRDTGGGRRSGNHSSILLPYEVVGEQVRPTSPDQDDAPAVLAQVRAAAG